MYAQFVKSGVMDAKVDPKVVMDLSMFKNGGWNNMLSGEKKVAGIINGLA